MGSVTPDTQRGRTLLKFVAVAVVSAGILVFWWRRDTATTTREREGIDHDFQSKTEPSAASAAKEERAPKAAVPTDAEPSMAAADSPAAVGTPPEQAPTPLSLPTCPERAPRDSTPCSVPADTEMNCGYREGVEPMTCRCGASSAGAMLWECRSDNEPSRVTLCPESPPVEGSSCSIAGQICFFGEAETAKACECESKAPLAWNCMTAVQYAARRH